MRGHDRLKLAYMPDGHAAELAPEVIESKLE